MRTQRDRVLETISDPDEVHEADKGATLALRLYPQTPVTRKFLAVAYREVSEEDGFVVTAYFTGRPSQTRRVIWKRSEF